MLDYTDDPAAVTLRTRGQPWGSKHPSALSDDFPESSAGKESTCNAGDPGSIPGPGRSPGEGIGYPLQYSCLENPTDCMVLGGHKESDTTEQFPV